MSTFDIKSDAPGLLRSESLNITLKFDRTGPNTGRISWNIPTPIPGCEYPTQAYCGMLITIDTTPITTSKVPVNGTVYQSDPTSDVNLFAGDKLGTAFVIGAFYEDRNTNFFDITGLTPNTPYYVSGFPVDCQYRYFIEGVHAYSLDYTNRGVDGRQGDQRVILNSDLGVSLTDYTGLTAGINYSFDIQIGMIPGPRSPVNPYECTPTDPKYTITVNGANATLYQDLIQEINKQLALLDNPYISTLAPNTGSLYWNGSYLYSWNGTSNSQLETIVQSDQPNIVIDGVYWYNPDNTTLYLRSAGSWVVSDVLNSNTDPLNPIAGQTFWFNGATGYSWNGSSWCELTTIIQNDNPSNVPTIQPGSYWFESDNGYMYKWDSNMEMWVSTEVLKSDTDPNMLLLGTYWFNESNNKLYIKDIPGIGWNELYNVSITEQAPITPAPGKIWYNPISKVLKQWRQDLQEWEVLSVIVYAIDPTQRQSCDLWWDTANDILKSWDIINNTWNQVVQFYNQIADPTSQPTIEQDTFWYSNGTSYVWRYNCFVEVQAIEWPTDPTNLLVDQIWHNTTNDTWHILDAGNIWQNISPTISDTDPTNLDVGTYWFSPTTQLLQYWNGVSWVNVAYSMNSPAPTKGTLWFNLNNNTLLKWDGINWTVSQPRAIVELDCHGNLWFTDSNVGSLSIIRLTDGNLFKSLLVNFKFSEANPGMDEVSNEPTYKEVGIGTDGSNEARLQLANEIRYELGYPVVDVELTQEQLDYAMTKALAELRAKSGIGYKHGFFFFYTKPETQQYYLTNKVSGYNKIVDILSIQRVNSLAIGEHDGGIYGHILAQFLYNAGNYDLLSYHLMTEYKKTTEILFAQRIQFNWNEQSRVLYFHQRTPYKMLLAIEATVERTEQDIMADRYCYPWVRRCALANARLMLAEIRGKYSTLPGAGGSITLNANDLRMAAKEELEACLAEIENYLADSPIEYGMASSFIFG